MAIKARGEGGGKALLAWPLVEELFLRLPLSIQQKYWRASQIKLFSYIIYFFYSSSKNTLLFRKT